MHLLAEDKHIGEVEGQTEEDEVGIIAVDTVGLIYVEGGPLLPGAEPLHDFVFAFPRHVTPRKNHFDVFPGRVLRDLALQEEVDLLDQLHHELRPGGDGVVLEVDDAWGGLEGILQEEVHVFVVFGGVVAPLALVVHLGAGCHPVDCNEESFARPCVVHDEVDVVEHGLEYFVEPFAREHILEDGAVVLGAAVQHSVQIYEEVVDLRHDLFVECASEERVSSSDPGVEVVDSHLIRFGIFIKNGPFDFWDWGIVGIGGMIFGWGGR